MKRQIFYSFHFDNDVMRVQQVRNIGALEDNKPVSANDWEKIKRSGDTAIEKWIDDNMKYRSCLVVLVGEKTSERKWVKKEIRKAWNSKKGVVGIYIHNLKDPKTGKCNKGKNPFDLFTLKNGQKKLSKYVKCYDPDSNDAYNWIAKYLESAVEEAIKIRVDYK